MQASFSFTIEAGGPGRPPEEPGRSAAGQSGSGLWFFGLTAMTLVFAALLIIVQLARGGSVDATVAPILFVYAIGMSVLGVGAVGYVVHHAHRLGMLANDGEPTAAVAGLSGLRIAPTVPPRRRRLPTQPQRHPGAVPATGSRSRRPAPGPRPATPVSIVATSPTPQVITQAPSSPPARAPSPPPRTPIHAIRMPRPAPSGASTRPYPFPASRVEPVALQVRVAGYRVPVWGPRPPSLVDRLLGRGTHRSYPAREGGQLPVRPVAPATPPRPAVLAHR